MKFFKIRTRIEHSDINNSGGEGEYWSNEVDVKDISDCQQKRLMKIFGPLVRDKKNVLQAIVEKEIFS